MSWRTWLGEGRKEIADFNLCDYPDLKSLCADAMWHMPAKVIGPTKEVLDAFLTEMYEEYAMCYHEFSVVALGEFGHCEDYHPDTTEHMCSECQSDPA